MNKRTRSVSERVLDCIKEMHEDFQANGVIGPISEYISVHGISASLGAVLQERGTIERISKREYFWKNGDPDMAMARAILQKTKERIQINKKRIKDQGIIKDKISVFDIAKELMEYLIEAKEYGVSEDQWEDYALKHFHRKHTDE